METHEIRTLEEYAAVTGAAVDVIVVTDAANGNRAHRPFCRTISEDTLRKKVLATARQERPLLLLPALAG